ncbi:MAG: indole-3-glycerol phosphate synthase TrpC [Saprospiraceae bacterium]
MNILEKIINHKQKELAERKSMYPVALLEKSIYFETPCLSMKSYLQRQDKSGIIAEFKRKSPSKGEINMHANIEEVSIGYMMAGASGLSVLTDTHFFGGKNEDLTQARDFNYCPILRKDFIVDEYQIIEAKSIGADAILLIAECLSIQEVQQLAGFARSLNLEVLLEMHSEKQLQKICPPVTMVGINNRDLETFQTNIETSLRLADQIPPDFVKVSESGISQASTIQSLKNAGYEGFLIGGYFMEDDEPHKRAERLVKALKTLV